MKATAELKMLPVSVLKPAAYNPRKKLKPGDKEYEKIKNSITEFGFADPLVVNADRTSKIPTSILARPALSRRRLRRCSTKSTAKRSRKMTSMWNPS